MDCGVAVWGGCGYGTLPAKMRGGDKGYSGRLSVGLHKISHNHLFVRFKLQNNFFRTVFLYENQTWIKYQEHSALALHRSFPDCSTSHPSPRDSSIRRGRKQAVAGYKWPM